MKSCTPQELNKKYGNPFIPGSMRYETVKGRLKPLRPCNITQYGEFIEHDEYGNSLVVRHPFPYKKIIISIFNLAASISILILAWILWGTL